jgi:hypothetical protein
MLFDECFKGFAGVDGIIKSAKNSKKFKGRSGVGDSVVVAKEAKLLF